MVENKFIWTIENFSTLKAKRLYSEVFFVGGHSWRILIFPKGNRVHHLSIYLDAGDIAKGGGSKFANFKLSLVDQVNCKKTQTKETEHEFNAEQSDWGFTNFIPLGELHDSRNGFIVNDACVIDAEVSVNKSEYENQVDQAVITQLCVEGIKLSDNPLPIEMSIPYGELVDFRGLGKIEKDFVPLLEEVCLQHPSLVESQKRRSRRFVEWSFTALGRVLHFLKTKKVKDMNDDTCNDLQILWEELETFKFDLTWLEPHFQSALGLKYYTERAEQVKKLKENVSALEMEIKGLKEKMDAAEVDLETARGDLAKAEEGFKECDVDAELGYGGP